jgi:hypothetical protein
MEHKAMNSHNQDQQQQQEQEQAQQLAEQWDRPELVDLIYGISRAQLLEHGDLVDVSEIAREAGFTVPVAMTRAAWADCVEWTEATQKREQTVQDEAGRLWDVLFMAKLAARRARGEQRVNYTLHRVPVEGRGRLPRPVQLTLHIGPGDAGEPVITIMQPSED